jgi:hypothetical protein
MDTAQEYAATIAEELRMWDDAASGDPDAIAGIAEEREHIDADDMPHAAEYINLYALEVITWRGGDSAVRVEILRTYGGPSCRIEWDNRYPATFDIVTHWGGSSSHVTVNAPTLGSQLEEVYV